MRKTSKLVLVLGLVTFVLLGLFTGCPTEVDEPKESVKAITITTDPEDVSALDNDTGVEVTLATATEGAKIYYTLDGTAPTAESTLYTTKFTVSTENEEGETITVKAIGIKEGLDNSTVAVKAITFNPVPEVELALATLNDWVNDRTEPESWTVTEGWVEITTKKEPANGWYAWQGKSAATVGPVATKYWEVETEIEITKKLLRREGVRTSLWLAVEGEEGFREANWAGVIDWSIIQFFIGPAVDGVTPDAVWQTWDSTYEEDSVVVGRWVDGPEGEIEAGTYTLKTIFDDGTITQFVNDVEINSYELEEDLSAPSAVIIQSYSYGEEYTVDWKVPVVKYLELEEE
jgi:hypothetical protein